ncbi:MAG: amidohydrolase [Bacteroidetes bacterium]|nr:amidohydrolase [Bacteroidota bacterium]
MRNLVYLLLIVLMAACYSGPTPALIVFNGKIWPGKDTLNSAPVFYEAMAIAGDSILALGSNQEIKSIAGSGTEMLDAGGRLVLPGFNDAHIHFLGGSMGLTQVELSATRSAAEVIENTNQFIRENPEAPWITGRGWQYTFYEGGLPDHRAMKEIQTDKPLFIRAYDGHSAYANRPALKLAGINPSTRFKGFGEIVFGPDGEPTGLLKESAMQLVSMLIPPPTREQKLFALKKGLQYAASLGITSVQNASGSAEDVSLFKELLESNQLTLRYAAAFSADASTSPDDILIFNHLKDSIGRDNKWIRADAIKFLIDGVIEGHTASMIGKYDDLSERDPLATGQMSMETERYKSLVSEFDKLGFRIYTHAIGDRGVRTSLDAYDNAAEINGERDSRHRVEHIETISPNDIPRFRTLGVMASMEPIHADPQTIEVWQKAIGQSRLPYSFAWNSMLKAKVNLVYSSDWPAAISLNPIRGIHVAVNRRTPEGFPEKGWVSEQKISIEEALHAYTYMGAYSSFEENRKGTLQKGKLADFIMVSENLFTIDPMRIYETKVLWTVVGGKTVFKNF